MCGISGIISLDKKPIKNLKSKILLMDKLLYHRGPDDSGFYINKKKNFGLSNNRLSIVAPIENIKLPFSKNNQYHLSFNGEIYNYELIRNDLFFKSGIDFKTKTDTEVLFEYLKKYNCNNLQKLNGMWSFAFYNEKKHHLTLSRDLLGERHLFYLIEDNKLYFSSEVKPILHVSDKARNIDEDSLIESWKYNSCAPGKTLIKDVFRLEPGTNLEVFNSQIKKKKHTKLNIDSWSPFFKKKPTFKKVFDKFEKILTKEIKLRIPKDVQFYNTLSGGIDSSIITYITNKIEPNFTKSIYVISGKNQIKKYNGISELELSKVISKKFKIKHKIIKSNSKKFVLNSVKKILKNSFEGCIDPNQINFIAISNFLKRKKIKVVLMSEGPDEFLSGYLTDIEAANVDKIYFNMLKSKKVFDLLKFKKKLNSLKLKKLKDFDISYSPFRTRVVHNMAPDVFLNKIFKNFKKEEFQAYDYLDKTYSKFNKKISYPQVRAINYATKTIPDMISLRKDKSMMINSVEPRFPFLAKNIVEFFIAMPNRYRFNKELNMGKYFLRKYCKIKISEKLYKFPKTGMGGNAWDYYKNFFDDLKIKKKIADSKLFKNPIFKKNSIKEILKKKTNKGNLWSAFILSEIYKELLLINNSKFKVKK